MVYVYALSYSILGEIVHSMVYLIVFLPWGDFSMVRLITFLARGDCSMVCLTTFILWGDCYIVRLTAFLSWGDCNIVSLTAFLPWGDCNVDRELSTVLTPMNLTEVWTLIKILPCLVLYAVKTHITYLYYGDLYALWLQIEVLP